MRYVTCDAVRNKLTHPVKNCYHNHVQKVRSNDRQTETM